MIGANKLFNTWFGFDSIFDAIDRRIDSGFKEQTYPPSDIYKTDDTHWQIELAVAGFSEQEISVTQEKNVLTVTGKIDTQEERVTLSRGIAKRQFKLEYRLGEHVEVEKVDMQNGLLIINLWKNTPEAAKPVSFHIGYRSPLLSIGNESHDTGNTSEGEAT
jgi:molecular chaperone IbpA